MSSRAEKLELLQKSLKKHFTPSETKTERNVLESLLYACCLEDTSQELADEAFAKLQQTYFDWNEVRVTTVIELSEVLSSLPNSSAAGSRIKKCLQSLYESRYQYDIDDLKKANLSKATEDIQAWDGVTPFVLNYVSQQSLGGHSIPFGTAALAVLTELDVITAAEADKKGVPGAERAIPKTKALEFSELLHAFAIEFTTNPKNPAVAAVFKDLGVTLKVPAAPAKKKEKEVAAPAAVETPKPTKPKAEPKTEPKVEPKADKVEKADKAEKAPTKIEIKEGPLKSRMKPRDTTDAAAKSAKAADKSAEKDDAKGSAKASSKGKSEAKAKADDTDAEADSADASKKTAKMANNVKMTKKKPK